MCKEAQLWTLILKAEYRQIMGRCHSKQKTQIKNLGSYYSYTKKSNRQQVGFSFDCHLPCLKPRAPWGEGHRGAGISSKQELTQHNTNLGAKSCSCPALAVTHSRLHTPAQHWHLITELFCTRRHIQSLSSSSRTRDTSLKCHLFTLFNRHQH